jgi:hypothetical protein
MEVTYALTMNDIYRFEAFLKRRRPIRHLGTLPSILLPSGVVLLLALTQSGASLSDPAVWGIALAFLLLWTPLLLWLVRRTGVRRNARALGRVTVRLLRDGLFVAGDLTETKYRWRGISEIADAPKYLYFFISPLVAVIIPKDAFGGVEAVHGFLAHARGLWSSGGESDVPLMPPDSRETWPPPPQRLA